MVSLVSESDSTCKCLELLLFMVMENGFMSWKFVLWVILEVNPFNRFGLLPTWIVLLQMNLHINIMLVMKMSYKGNLVYF